MKILPFATTWMNLEDLMLSEISQTQKDTSCKYHLHEEFEKNKFELRNREQNSGCQGMEGGGNGGEVDQRVQNFSYKRKIHCEYLIYSTMTTVNISSMPEINYVR